MKRTIIVLKGKGNTGKSGTLKRAYVLLAKKQDITVISFEKIGWKVDFFAVLRINGKKVGFCSQGDIAEWLEEYLLKLKAEGCTVIVCTTRTKGRTVKTVESFQPSYVVKWLAQVEHAASDREKGNSVMARRIMKEIEHAVLV